MEGDIVRKIQSCYLRNEQRYDKWGAQGKLLAAHEVLQHEGRSVTGPTLHRLVNRAFPRTFSCQGYAAPPPPSAEVIESYYADIRFALSREGLVDPATEHLALEETSETFCLSIDFVRRLTRPLFLPANE